MKRFVLVTACVVALVSSSCTVFVLNEDDHERSRDKDTISVTVISSAKAPAGEHGGALRR